MKQTQTKARKATERQAGGKKAAMTEIAKHAVRGGPKTEKRNRRPGAGGAQKG